MKHEKEKAHKLCTCGGYHYAHRPGSKFCELNEMSPYWLAARSGATDEELEEIAIELAWEGKGGKVYRPEDPIPF